MYIELKADDVMPFGKYIGITLRELYKRDAGYFFKLCSQTADYGISSKTQKIVINDLKEIEKTKPSFSKTTNNKSELKIDDLISGGPFNGKTLYEAFTENESYYRYLCDYRNYISEITFHELEARKAGKSSIKTVIKPAKKETKTILHTDRFAIPDEFKTRLRSLEKSKADEIERRLHLFEQIQVYPKHCKHSWNFSIEALLLANEEVFEKALSRTGELPTMLSVEDLSIWEYLEILLKSDKEYLQIGRNYKKFSSNSFFESFNDSPDDKNELLLLDSPSFSRIMKRVRNIKNDHWKDYSTDIKRYLLELDANQYCQLTAIMHFSGQSKAFYDYICSSMKASNSNFQEILSRIEIFQEAFLPDAIQQLSPKAKSFVLFAPSQEEFNNRFDRLKYTYSHQYIPDNWYSSYGDKTINEPVKACVGDCATCNREKCVYDK